MSTKDLILSRENVKRFSLGNVSETLPDSKLKAILGGYGGYAECCSCTWDLWCEGNLSSKKGTICGNEGDINCNNGMTKLHEQMWEGGCHVESLNCG